MPRSRALLNAVPLEDRITPDGGMSSFETLPDFNDPDDQISEAIPIGRLGPDTLPFRRDDEIRLPETSAYEGRKTWSDVFAMNGKDVDMYSISVDAGDRIRFTTVSTPGVTSWTEPATPTNPDPQPIRHTHISPNPMALFDGARTWLSDVPAEKGVGDARSLAVDPSHQSYRLEYTFHRTGTYYLAVSNDSNYGWPYGPRRFHYDPVTGTGDTFNPSGGQGSFGPYVFAAEYMAKDLPDLVADEIVTDGTTLTFSYHVEQAVYTSQFRGRPADWSHGVELHWFDANGADLGAIDPNSQAAKNLVQFNADVRVWDARPLTGTVQLAELGVSPLRVRRVGLKLNASLANPEVNLRNNLVLLQDRASGDAIPVNLQALTKPAARGLRRAAADPLGDCRGDRPHAGRVL